MTHRNRWNNLILLLLLCWLPTIVHAQSLALIWEFERDFLPAPDSFILAQTEEGHPEQYAKVALSAEGVCPGGGSNDHNTFCVSLAKCPEPGTIVAYWIYAQWGTQVSAPSNIATCYMRPGAPCVCVDPSAIVASPPSTPPPPAIHPSGLATRPPQQISTATAPAVLASASPPAFAFQIPQAPSIGGT